MAGFGQGVGTRGRDTSRHGVRHDDLSHKVSFVTGALWVVDGLIVLVGLLLGWYITGRLNVTFTPGS